MDDIYKLKKQLNAIEQLQKMAEQQYKSQLQVIGELVEQEHKVNKNIADLEQEIDALSAGATSKSIHFYFNSVTFLAAKTQELGKQQQLREVVAEKLHKQYQKLRELVQKKTSLQTKLDKNTLAIAKLKKQKSNRLFNSFITSKRFNAKHGGKVDVC